MSFKFLKSDAISGFLVFLIALPLCLGIAKASGFPPIAGIYTAVIGGLLVTFLSNAQLAIKGPAAGLIVIAIGAVEELGGEDHIMGYKLTLAVVVVSGALQVLFGFVKAGKLADFFPESVIRGMLAAIGIIILSKQIHIVMGVVPEAKKPIDLLIEVPKSFMAMNPEVAFIGFVSLLVLFIHPRLKFKFIRQFPAPLLVLLLALPMSLFFDLTSAHDYEIGSLSYHIDPEQLLVALPNDFFSGITFPDFSQILSYTSIKYIIMFSLVGSIESVLSAKAVDTLDPKGRKSNMNRDLVAVGVGNTLAGFIGGLPMISEIVRSSANINNGAQTRMSNFFHGAFLFLFVLLAAAVIKMIPNAALSAMLVYTGLKLASIEEIKKIKSIGFDQFLQFATTLLVTLFIDLLVGVIVGIVLKFALELFQGAKFREMIKIKMDSKDKGDDGLEVKIGGVASLLNYLQLKALLDKQPLDKKVVLDFSDAHFVDHSFLHNVHELQNEFGKNGGELRKVGFERHHFLSDHDLATRRTVVNPTQYRVDDPLTKREKVFSALSAAFNVEFEADASPSLVRPYLAPFAIISRFQKAGNFLIANREHYSFMVCDLTYEDVDDFSLTSKQSTVAVVYNIDRGGVPNFYTSKKSTFVSQNRRYDYPQVPASNDLPFDIFTEDLELFGRFGTPELLKLITRHGYSIECQRRKFLIHQNWEKLPEGPQLENFITFVEEFSCLITGGEKGGHLRITEN